jgi:hypothetical protein
MLLKEDRKMERRAIAPAILLTDAWGDNKKGHPFSA